MHKFLYDAGFPALRRFRIPPVASGAPDCVNRVQRNFPIKIEED
jgi:hypothetical protein